MNFGELTGFYLDAELRTDDSTVLFTSTRRSQAINDAYDEFCDLTECLLRVSTVTCSCNTATYNLNSSAVMSTNFVRIAARGVEYHRLSSHGGSSAQLTQLAGDDFPRRDVEWLNVYEPGWRQSTTPTDPHCYALEMDGGAHQIRLVGPPDIGSSETGKLLVPFVAKPDPMTSTSDVPFTVGSATRTDLYPFHQALVHGAAYRLEKLRGDDQAQDRQRALFLDYIERFTGKFRAKGKNMVTFARHYLREARGRSRVVKDPYRDF